MTIGIPHHLDDVLNRSGIEDGARRAVDDVPIIVGELGERLLVINERAVKLRQFIKRVLQSVP